MFLSRLYFSNLSLLWYWTIGTFEMKTIGIYLNVINNEQLNVDVIPINLNNWKFEIKSYKLNRSLMLGSFHENI